MAGFIIRRSISLVFVMIVVSMFVFYLMSLVPGGPFSYGERVTENWERLNDQEWAQSINSDPFPDPGQSPRARHGPGAARDAAREPTQQQTDDAFGLDQVVSFRQRSRPGIHDHHGRKPGFPG